jgi:hypothetical protein
MNSDDMAAKLLPKRQTVNGFTIEFVCTFADLKLISLSQAKGAQVPA